MANTGQLPLKMITDAGYCSTSNIQASEQRGLEVLPLHQPGGVRQAAPAITGPAPRDLHARERMDRKIHSKPGQTIYALLKTNVEPVFGQIKGARGLDCFLLLDLEKVYEEWTLMDITHNFGKLHRGALAAS